LGAVASVKARLGWKGLKASEYVDDGFIFLSTPNIKGPKIDFYSVDHIPAQRYYESPEIMLQNGDVLIAKDGSTLGIANVVRSLPAPATVNSSIAVIRPVEKLNSVYCFYFLASHYIQSTIGRMKDGMGVPHLFQADLRKFTVLLPPELEQVAIAEFLDRQTSRIGALIEKKERLITLLEEKRAALITRAVTKGLDPNARLKDSGILWLGAIPANWETRRLKYLSNFITSGSRGWADHYSDDGAIFLRIGNLTREGIDLDLSDIQRVQPPPGAEGERTSVNSGDLLVSITADIGSVAVVPDNLAPGFVNQHLALVRLRSDLVSPRFVGYALRAASLQAQFRLALYGGTKQGLGLDDVANLLVTLPPLSEQARIVTNIDSAVRRIKAAVSKTREQIAKFQEYRTALISAAVTGKIDVRGSGAEQAQFDKCSQIGEH
jgi:type I restriction enzyme S subunit